MHQPTHLLLADERTPKHADSLTDHSDVKLVFLLEPCNDVLQSGIILELEPVPKRPFGCSVLALSCGDGFRESKEGECEVDESVLEIF